MFGCSWNRYDPSTCGSYCPKLPLSQNTQKTVPSCFSHLSRDHWTNWAGWRLICCFSPCPAQRRVDIAILCGSLRACSRWLSVSVWQATRLTRCVGWARSTVSAVEHLCLFAWSVYPLSIIHDTASLASIALQSAVPRRVIRNVLLPAATSVHPDL